MSEINRSSYRPDVDGLRAIAVIAVVLFHLSKDLVPGGFAGVDIFFVISGYLITFMTYGQIKDNSFTYSSFYKRRINRIIPALMVVTACVLAAGLIILSPADLAKLFKSAVATALGVSNLYFWREYGNYFNSGVDEAPLLHTWSLGVEEQFYIIWPAILLWLARLRNITKLIMAVLVLAAMVLVSELGIRSAASASYYLLPTRFFELAIGSALAIFIAEKGAPFKGRWSSAMGNAGLLLVFASLFLLSEATPFPGVNALYPCVGTALVIAAGADAQSFSARVLSFKPLVLIGLISYSLYLWHWPLIAYAHYLEIPIGVFAGALIFLASVLLAWCSWRFVEMPCRRSGAGMTFAAAAFRRYMIPVTAIGLSAFAVIASGGLPNRFDPRVVEYEKIMAVAPEQLHEQCHSSTFFYQRQPNPTCLLGASARPADLLLIGDSYANHFTGMVDVLAKRDGLSVLHYTMDGCPPIKDMGFGSVASYIEKCRSRNNFSYEFIASKHFKYVLLGASWPNDGTPDDFARLRAGLDNSISSILASGATPIIILNNQGTKNAHCPIRRLMAGSSTSCEKAPDSNRRQWQMFQSLKLQYPALVYIDPNKVICEKTRCRSVIADVPLYRDSGHLNDIGSRLIGAMLIEQGVHLTQGDATPSLFEAGQSVATDQVLSFDTR